MRLLLGALRNWTSTIARHGAVLVLALSLFIKPAGATDADQLMRYIDRLWRGETSQATLSMTVKTQRYERTMTMEAWSRGNEYSLIRIREPVKDRGVATLKVAENIWNYLPKINRVARVPASMMGGAWMGSHFTNDDLVRESTYEDDYDSHLTFEGVRDGQLIYELTSFPKPDAAVVWGRVVSTIEQSSLAPLLAKYFDEDGVLVRTITFDQVQEVAGRAVPMRLTLLPEDAPSESTVIVYHEIELGVPLTESFFSLQNLQRRR